MLTKLECLEKFNNSNQIADYVIIWLHGLGADYTNFLPVISELDLTSNVKFIFPNAQIRPITINGGYEMRGWYDIRDFASLENNIDAEGIYQSCIAIDELIQQQTDLGIESTKIILAGFSQGGVMSYITSLLTPHKLGGVIALSCYLPIAKTFIEKSPRNNIDTPIYASHGTNDEVVPFMAGIMAKDELKSAGYKISWYEYPAGHEMTWQQIIDIRTWLNNLNL